MSGERCQRWSKDEFFVFPGILVAKALFPAHCLEGIAVARGSVIQTHALRLHEVVGGHSAEKSDSDMIFYLQVWVKGRSASQGENISVWGVQS